MADDLRTVLRETSSIRRVALRNKVTKWLSAPDPSIDHVEARNKWPKPSCRWFIDGHRYRCWKDQPDDAMWIHGIPGAGKTILSTNVIQDLLFECRKDACKGLAYFYFTFNDSKKQSCECMLRSLVQQLSSQSTDSMKLVENLYRSCGEGSSQAMDSSILQTLEAMMTCFSTVSIVLDALDESASRPRLLSKIQEICSWRSGHLRLLVVSRTEGDLLQGLQPLMPQDGIVEIQCDLVNEDMCTYIRQRLSQDHHLKKWQKSLKITEKIESQLLQKADRMFRWVECHLDELGNCLSRQDLKDALQTLPKDLNETYSRILGRIDPRRSTNAIKVLQWLAFSKKQLTFEEVSETMAIDVGAKNTFDTDRRLEEETDILRICPSLVTITTSPHQHKGEKMIKLAHFTVEEFIATDARFTGENTARENANMVIAADCVGYLVYIDPSWELKRIKSPEVQPILIVEAARRGLTRMVKRLLDDGANVDEQGDDSRTALDEAAAGGYSVLVELLLRAGANVECFAGSKSQRRSALLFAASHGQDGVVRRLLDAGASINGDDGGESPLVAACREGHLSTAQILLAQGANANSSTNNGFFGSALYYTCLYKSRDRSLPEAMLISTIQLLLSHGANIEARGFCGTPLLCAASNSNVSAMKLLVAAGADVKVQGPSGSLLTAVCRDCHGPAVDFVLDLGIDVNAQGGYDGNALQAASAEGNISVVRVLLERGAEVNIQGGDFGNALQAALAGYDDPLPVLQLLIDEGAEVNAEGGPYGTALQAASFRTNTSVVRFLLEKGAKVNIQGGTYGNALEVASACASIEIMDLLLEHGAEVNARGGKWDNALQAACIPANDRPPSRYPGVCLESMAASVQLLIDKGADVNARGGKYGTPLRAASFEGSDSVIGFLLENGAEINNTELEDQNTAQTFREEDCQPCSKEQQSFDQVQNDPGHRRGTALQVAAAQGHVSTVQLLLDKGAKINTQVEWLPESAKGYISSLEEADLHGNALQAAACNAHIQVAKVLLKHGADPNVKGGKCGTALQAASFGDHDDSLSMVEILLESRADPAIAGGEYGTALVAACSKGSEPISQLLLQQGANPHDGSGRHGTALQAASLAGSVPLVKLLLEYGVDVNAGGEISE
ncbi:MAG: hypothetical protein Q9212_003845 [Teloschistes hypoglaucus]